MTRKTKKSFINWQKNNFKQLIKSIGDGQEDRHLTWYTKTMIVPLIIKQDTWKFHQTIAEKM